jgi:hypothetical protein
LPPKQTTNASHGGKFLPLQSEHLKKTANKKTVRKNIFSNFFNTLGAESGGGCPLARDGLFASADTTRKKTVK